MTTERHPLVTTAWAKHLRKGGHITTVAAVILTTVAAIMHWYTAATFFAIIGVLVFSRGCYWAGWVAGHEAALKPEVESR